MFSKAAAPFTSLPVHLGAHFSMFLPHLLSSVLLILAILVGVKWHLIVVLTCIFLMMNDGEHLVVQSLSLAQLCDPRDCIMPGLPVRHQLLEFAQTYVHWVMMPSNHLCWTSFHVLVGHCLSSLEKHLDPLPIFSWVAVLSCKSSLYILDTRPLWDLWLFSPILRFHFLTVFSETQKL